MDKHRIEWLNRPGTVGESWNPITGCTPISEGCANCYARRMAKRLAGRCGYPEAPHEFDVTLHPDKLFQPWHWRKPRTVFVCSMSDLFHEDVPTQSILDVWNVMERAHQHTFIVLTKRPARAHQILGHDRFHVRGYMAPLLNVWLGVTAENQERADERIPWLLKTPAAVRFVSVEPMLGPMLDMWDYFPKYDYRPTYAYWRTAFPDAGDQPILEREGVNWVICGAETGAGARPMDLQWARDLRDQCKEADVPFFFKRAGPGQETPPDLMVREFPHMGKEK